MARRSKWPKRGRTSSGDPGLRHGFRSGLEGRIAKELESLGVTVLFESVKIPYVSPALLHSYTVDFPLPNGILVETKGIFDLADRKKHLLIKAQHPRLDLRFVFQNPKAKLYKGSPTSYADWCDRAGFKYAAKSIPVEWLKEKGPGRIITTPVKDLPAHTKPTRSTPPPSKQKASSATCRTPRASKNSSAEANTRRRPSAVRTSRSSKTVKRKPR